MVSYFRKNKLLRAKERKTVFARNLWCVLLPILLCLLFSCTRRLGYGILLWSAEDPPIPSGTVLPVYIRSNIDQVWVTGIPEEYRSRETRIDKLEIPLSKLELAGSKTQARRRAEEFAPYALSYAETLQDGLPIRESPDNGARRVYRLRLGEIIKILSPAIGIAAVGTTGDALPGEWFKVLTENGTLGYCFSYRLRLFEHGGGSLAALPQNVAAEDPELEQLLSRTWSADVYGTMVNTRKINLEDFYQGWSFDPGQDTGIAHIKTQELDRSFSYTAIRPTGTRSWRFEGSPLQMNLRSDTTLVVQFSENGGLLRTFLFTELATSLEDLIDQETVRRQELFNTIYDQGPAYTSHNYGTLTFSEDGRFSWSGYELLVPHIIPASVFGNGFVDMRLFLDNTLTSRYDGAFTLRFNTISADIPIDFMYTLDSQGFRLEYVPDTSMNELTVSRRASSPLVLYFYRSETPVILPGLDYGGFGEYSDDPFVDDSFFDDNPLPPIGDVIEDSGADF
jgi:hypothetical protein